MIKTLQNSSFHKTVFTGKRTFCTILHWHCNFNFFQKIGHDKRLAVFTGKLLQTLENSSFHKTII